MAVFDPLQLANRSAPVPVAALAAAIFDQHSVDLLADHSHVQLEHEYTPAWSRLVGSVAPEAALFSELGVLSGREHSDWLNGYLKEKMKINNARC